MNVCRRTAKGTHVLATVLDKVVQDITGEEGTGVWSNIEAIRLHEAAPTLSTAHAFLWASAFLELENSQQSGRRRLSS